MFVSGTDNSITIGLRETEDNGGSEIQTYKLHRDGGDLSTGVTIEVTNYDGYSSQITVSGLIAAKKYRFVYNAVNEFGES